MTSSPDPERTLLDVRRASARDGSKMVYDRITMPTITVKLDRQRAARLHTLGAPEEGAEIRRDPRLDRSSGANRDRRGSDRVG